MNFSGIAIAIATIGTIILSRIASAAELPSYEAMGFPITPHQISVWGRPKLKSSRLALMRTSPSRPRRGSTASNHGDGLESI